MIALFCMTLDHFAVALFNPLISAYCVNDSIYYEIGTTVYLIMRLIGRLAFPLYCFFIYEGFNHTRNILKYSGRLLLLAIISEIPFNLMLNHTMLSARYQNVFWTLLIGLIVIWEIDGFEKRKINKYLIGFLQFVIVMAGIALAECFHTDYGAIGVFAVVIYWLLAYKKRLIASSCILVITVANIIFGQMSRNMMIIQILFVIAYIYLLYTMEKRYSGRIYGVFGCTLGLTVNNSIEFSSFLIIPLMLLYNGERGKINKWVFYFYYPVHILLFALVGILIGVYK